MTTQLDLTTLAGTTVVGRDGDKIGKVVDVYASNDGGTEGTFVTPIDYLCNRPELLPGFRARAAREKETVS